MVQRLAAEPVARKWTRVLGFQTKLALICGALLLTVAMGIRQTFGLFLAPMSIDLGLGREAFAFAMALQNLLWGAAQPLAGMVADRYGTLPVLLAGTAAYALGLTVMSGAASAWGLYAGGGVLVGLAMSGHQLCRGAWRRRPPCCPGKTEHGSRRGQRRRLVRTVYHGAGRTAANRR